MSITTAGLNSCTIHLVRSSLFYVRCSDSNPPRGFGRQRPKKADIVNPSREDNGQQLQKRKSTNQSRTMPAKAPALNSPSDRKSKNIVLDTQFEERLESVRRSAYEQKKANESEEYGAIDYDAQPKSEEKTIGLGTKVGVGVAIIVFGLVFALGDFIPNESISPSKEADVVDNKLSEEERLVLQTRLQQYEAALSTSPKDPTALEGAAVTLAQLGEYPRAASRLEELMKENPSNPDAFRLLGEVKYGLKDYEGSAAAYRSSVMVSKTINFEVLRDLTNALLAAKKPDEAVEVLLASRERLTTKDSVDSNAKFDIRTMEKELEEVDPIQVDLLLGKAYSDWGHISDAVTVYDNLIATHPDDFRGFLAKGIILKENGKIGDAERVFIQARFLAPEKAKALVDRYSRK
ncbi:uncharacterized protein LOC131158334 isoform X2 [Malania oleifera]|uniref:uncharacterized protein LOC131158334 isoform X2 n=1 Tax=Malania oleifera TaxID=397392 RepID=UPI0025ADEE44|nr:uncharacterized protein LOC131158334 isoform X2 [Malania oleifera]